ncbi:dihydroorotate dehydrogenase PyrD [Stygiolobus caldivivus]|uniref:Dihydroorotate dehydrogenase n=1 Tax=Stygiolobus caldivivus TaxID=2824673 RepID=A0A8D5U9F9_9CREN|nr:dihydroorotate dehydrogenase PyrD [Stygiolobus caldivivus]BCU71377.1 dihydroorotate dehydrogenase [Stygiolobus caldivivus]
MVKVANVEFKDPFIISSGIIPLVSKFISNVCVKYDISGITTKTLTLSPLEPHRPPTVIKLEEGCYMNAIGLGNPGIETLREFQVKGDCNLIISIGGSGVEDIMKSAEKIEDIRRQNINLGEKVKILELNLSSPNRKGYGESTSKFTLEIVKNVSGVTSLPVFVKLGPWDNTIELAGKALEGGANGLTLINTIKGLAISKEEFKPILSYGTGGISGKCIHPLAVRIIHDVYKEYKPEIIGMGGVFTWEDAIELMAVGAKLVGLGTVIIDRGYQVINDIRLGFRNYLKEKGLKIEEVIGIGVRN